MLYRRLKKPSTLLFNQDSIYRCFTKMKQGTEYLVAVNCYPGNSLSSKPTEKSYNPPLGNGKFDIIELL